MAKSEKEAPAAAPEGTESPAAKPAAAPQTLERWARAKGHIPAVKVVRFPGDAIHRAPHIEVVRAHLGRAPLNLMMTEADYDAAVKAAYSVGVGEQIQSQADALKSANKRAEGTK